MVYVIAALVFLLLFVLILALRRAEVPRYVSQEGIENTDVVEAYNRINRWPQFKVLRKIFVAELEKYQPKGRLADIGCGPGYLLADLARYFPDISITGVDIAEEMLTKANENAVLLSVIRDISLRQGDIQQLPFEDSSIDFIIKHPVSTPLAQAQSGNRGVTPCAESRRAIPRFRREKGFF